MIEENKIRYWSQILSAIGICFSFMVIGTAIGYPTSALPQLELETDPDMQLSAKAKSWFAPILNLCVFFFMIPGSIINDKIGRRGLLLFAMPFIIGGWILIGFARNSAMLIAGRIISCAFTCMTMSVPGVYISETSHPRIRSSLLVMLPFFYSMGLMLVWFVGYLSSWRIVAFCCIPPCIVSFLSCFLLPETPYWLIEKNRYEEAEDSLRFYRGPNFDISEEIAEIHKKHLSKPESKSVVMLLKRIFSSAFLKPYMCIGIIEALFNISGFEITLVYMVDLLRETGSGIDPYLGPVIIGAVRFVTSGFMPLIMQRVSPKLLFFISQLIHALSIGALSLSSYLKLNQFLELHYFAWLPLTAIILVATMRAIGSLPVIQTLVNELYPTDIRTHSIAINDSIGFLISTVNLALYPEMKRVLGVYGIFGIYTIISVLLAFWGLFTIPDNRGKSLVQVEESFETKPPPKLESVKSD